MIAKNRPIPEQTVSDAKLAKMRQAIDQVRENIQTRGAWINLLEGAKGLIAAGEYVEACFILNTLAAIALGWWTRCRLGKGIQSGMTPEIMLQKLVSSLTIDRPAYDAASGILKRAQLDAKKAQGLLNLIGWASDAIGDIPRQGGRQTHQGASQGPLPWFQRSE